MHSTKWVYIKLTNSTIQNQFRATLSTMVRVQPCESNEEALRTEKASWMRGEMLSRNYKKSTCLQLKHKVYHDLDVWEYQIYCLVFWERHPTTGAGTWEDFNKTCGLQEPPPLQCEMQTTEACPFKPTPELYDKGHRAEDILWRAQTWLLSESTYRRRDLSLKKMITLLPTTVMREVNNFSRKARKLNMWRAKNDRRKNTRRNFKPSGHKQEDTTLTVKISGKTTYHPRWGIC